MAWQHEHRFPGESEAYRTARDRLLREERALRRKTEEVAALRRALPTGGALKEDYVFTESAAGASDPQAVTGTPLSALFAPGLDTLAIYSFMYPPGGDACPMCAAFLDGLDGNARHIGRRVNLAVVAKAPIGAVRAFAASRGWTDLRLLSSGGTGYNADYLGEGPDGRQWPMVNVFRRTAGGIRHFYASELFLVAPEEGQHPRHVDALWPLWNVLDLTPEGRGGDWWPGLAPD